MSFLAGDIGELLGQEAGNAAGDAAGSAESAAQKELQQAEETGKAPKSSKAKENNNPPGGNNPLSNLAKDAGGAAVAAGIWELIQGNAKKWMLMLVLVLIGAVLIIRGLGFHTPTPPMVVAE